MYLRASGNCHDISENLHAQHLLDQDEVFDFSKDICHFCNEKISTEQKYALLKSLISKKPNVKYSRNKIGLRTENTIMNHMIKRWAHAGVYKQEVLFEDEMGLEK